MNAIRLTGRLLCADKIEAAIVLRHLDQHIALTRAEPGCLQFNVEPTGDPLVWTVRERFVDQTAFDAHQSRVRASEWGRATARIKRGYVIVPDVMVSDADER
ncbi:MULTISPECIES: antibiotic biosynthesis monooxygenase [Bacteria]|uniref:putative quinol monooxygenase n=1 Tax=Bacteria TaxID=2 RepID=UPI0018CD4C59|nr:antibiotic biosynthesis monooxygenase [Bacillus toyonensis]